MPKDRTIPTSAHIRAGLSIINNNVVPANIGESLRNHQFWFITSLDNGETWQLTDGPFTEAEADRLKPSFRKLNGREIKKKQPVTRWALIQTMSIEGV